VSATRLLVLGVLRMHGRAHGYLIRSELLSWGAEEWANVKFGSIYHALRQMAKENLLKSTEIADWPGRVDYEITPAGVDEFLRLLRDALRHRDYRPDILGAALIMLPALPRDEAIALLRERLAALAVEQDELVARVQQAAAERRERAHIRELLGLWEHAAVSDAAWTQRLIGELEGGMYIMAGEESTDA
jgi:DNA-binding PadR family transcriptional regulator